MNPIRPVAVKLGSQPWLPRFGKQIVTVDHTIQRVTFGRVTLLTLAGLPELVLTVRGRKSGVERSTPLLGVPHDDAWLVAGSNWGMPELPGWARNLDAADEARVTYRGRETVVVPRRSEGSERAIHWEVLVEVWPNYEVYARRTEREIPIYVLAPYAD
ncbi:hypothetical protein N505_0120595 [Rhodococcus aetherivorans]|nr:hypothetical protein N505_0120595 [Rhodococcus aetherivorans]